MSESWFVFDLESFLRFSEVTACGSFQASTSRWLLLIFAALRSYFMRFACNQRDDALRPVGSAGQQPHQLCRHCREWLQAAGLWLQRAAERGQQHLPARPRRTVPHAHQQRVRPTAAAGCPQAPCHHRRIKRGNLFVQFTGVLDMVFKVRRGL